MWLLCLGVAPISEPRVLDDQPEARIRHAVEEPLDGLGSLRPVTRSTRAAREQRPQAEQFNMKLQKRERTGHHPGPAT